MENLLLIIFAFIVLFFLEKMTHKKKKSKKIKSKKYDLTKGYEHKIIAISKNSHHKQKILNKPLINIKKKIPKKYDLKKHYEREITMVNRNIYGKQNLLNKPETSIYWHLVKICQDLNKEYKVFSQVNLGEILTHKNRWVYKAIMCKRVDFCITDKHFSPIATVEHNGTGHNNSTSKQRDKIKQEAVQSAGILFLSINTNSKIELNNLAEEIQKL
jgi:hypothetical protein